MKDKIYLCCCEVFDGSELLIKASSKKVAKDKALKYWLREWCDDSIWVCDDYCKEWCPHNIHVEMLQFDSDGIIRREDFF